MIQNVEDDQKKEFVELLKVLKLSQYVYGPTYVDPQSDYSGPGISVW